LISGTTDFRNASAAAMPDGAFGAHCESLPSWQRSGITQDSEGVVSFAFRSVASWARLASFLEHALVSTKEWKYRNGLRQVAWRPPELACVSGLSSFGCLQASW
jgi:hypothetical protein